MMILEAVYPFKDPLCDRCNNLYGLFCWDVHNCSRLSAFETVKLAVWNMFCECVVNDHWKLSEKKFVH